MPIAGRWTTLAIDRDDPRLAGGPIERPSGKLTATALGLQGGLDWQTEETREGGRWRRHYGFVGRDRIARVPAEEMDFLAPRGVGWCEVSRDLDARITPTDHAPAIVTGQPLSIVVAIRNRRGIATTAPVDFSRAGADGPELCAGVSVRVFRAPDVPVPVRPDDPEPPRWPEINGRRAPKRYSSDAVRTLQPTESVDVVRLDLRDLFDLDRPGRYRVDIELAGLRTDEGKPVGLAAYFRLADAGDAKAP